MNVRMDLNCTHLLVLHMSTWSGVAWSDDSGVRGGMSIRNYLRYSDGKMLADAGISPGSSAVST
jgi:hypothetical protein